MRDVFPFSTVCDAITRGKNSRLDIVESIVEFGLCEAVAMAQDILVVAFENENVGTTLSHRSQQS